MGRSKLTILRVVRVRVDVQFLVSLQRLFQKNNLLLALHSTGSGVGLALSVAFHAVELHHFFNAFQVLFLDIELELDLGQHQLDAGPKVRVIVFDKI
jgi:hypothetical protein